MQRNEASDLYVLAAAFYSNLQIDNCEYGAIGVDCKRPFGNSDVEADILEMLGCAPAGDDGQDKCWSSEQREYAADLYTRKLIPFLQNRWEDLTLLRAQGKTGSDK